MASFLSEILSNCWYQSSGISASIFFRFFRWIPPAFERIADRTTKSIVANVILSMSPFRDDMVVYL